jgi:3-oxoadipate enol-lactonase
MRIRGIDLFVEEEGEGQPLLFSHGLLWSGRMFAPQVRALSGSYRCISYDHRGQGRSEIPKERTIEIESVYQDAVALIEALGIAPCHFVGLSMGGFVGMRIAARRPELLRSLVLIATAADPEPKKNLPRYRLLNTIARLGVLRALSGQLMPIMFGESFLRDPARAAERAALEQQLREHPRRIYRAVNGVLYREGVEHELSRITVPTLVLRGDEDHAIALERAERLHRGIRGSRLVRLPRGGHTVTLEEPDLVTREIRQFLEHLPG